MNFSRKFVGKLMLDFLLVIIEHFSLALSAEALRAKIRRNWPLLKGVGHFEANVRLNGYVYRQHLNTVR